MDSELFSKILKQLLPTSSKVVLPGFGEFYVQQVGASFSDRGFTINPPYKKIAFRLSEDNDDSLARFLAKSNDVDFSAAKSVVDDYVKRLREQLQGRRGADFPGLGRMVVSRGNEIFFIQEGDLSIFPDMDCLDPLSMRNRSELHSSAPSPVAREEAGSGANQVSAAESATVERSVSVTEAATVDRSMADEHSMAGPAATTVRHQSSAKPSSAIHWWSVTLLAIVSLLALAFAALAILGRTCPDFVDTFLYSAEELEIIRTVI